MNREIKFRVWDNVDYMSTPFTLEDIQLRKIQFASDCIVMQFTGLFDKNGVEIYEGDIIRVTDEKKVIKGAVNYCDLFAGFAYSDEDWNYRLSATAEHYRVIIGNIYEHPELLTTQKQSV